MPQDIVIKTLKVSCTCVPVLVFACVCVCVCVRATSICVRENLHLHFLIFVCVCACQRLQKKHVWERTAGPDLQFQLWGYAPAHTTTTPHDPPHATIPPRDDPPTRHNAMTNVRLQLKDLSPPCALYYPQNLEVATSSISPLFD
jgi:hypothetical protein